MDDEILRSDYWYPSSERLPAKESCRHLDETIYLLQALKQHFHRDPNVYVSGDLFLFHTGGGPVANHEPDVFVVRDFPGDASTFLRFA
jgi:hypothetical protein